MARKCMLTGKAALSGNNRSHSMRATRRTWDVNLQKHTIEIDGQKVQVRLSARGYRTLLKANKQKAA